MKNQVLTKEQMDELIALGVDVCKASMCRVSLGIGTPATDESMLVENDKNFYGMSFPVLTVTDMLEMMPKCIDGHYIELVIGNSYGYCCRYFSDYTENELYFSEEKYITSAVYGTFLQLAKDGKLNNTPK